MQGRTAAPPISGRVRSGLDAERAKDVDPLGWNRDHNYSWAGDSIVPPPSCPAGPVNVPDRSAGQGHAEGMKPGLSSAKSAKQFVDESEGGPMPLPRMLATVEAMRGGKADPSLDSLREELLGRIPSVLRIEQLNAILENFLRSQPRGRGDRTTLADHLWATEPPRLTEAGRTFLSKAQTRALESDLYVNELASGSFMGDPDLQPAHLWIEPPIYSPWASMACLIHMRFQLNLAAFRPLPGGPRRSYADLQEPVTVGYRSASGAALFFVGTIQPAGKASLVADLSGDPRLKLVMRQRRWPYRETVEGPSVVLIQDETVIELPLRHDWLSGITSGPYRFRVKNRYFLADMCLPAAVAKDSIEYPQREGSDIPIAESFFGAQLALAWLCTDTALDIWSTIGENGGLALSVERHRQKAHIQLRRMAGEQQSTSREIVDSVIERVRSVPDPLGRIALGDELSKELMPAVYEQMMADAAEFRAGGGTWKEIGQHLNVTASAAQNRLDPEARRRNAERARERAKRSDADPSQG